MYKIIASMSGLNTSFDLEALAKKINDDDGQIEFVTASKDQLFIVYMTRD
jgi:hypothetical protein